MASTKSPGKCRRSSAAFPLKKQWTQTRWWRRKCGAALTKDHGFPARALVPGWVGAASCKWLTEIKVLDKEFDGNFMKPAYRMPNEPVKPGESVNPDATYPLTALAVKSLIASPSDGATLKKHAIQIHGAAWAGEADIARVEISTDSGAAWQQAQLGNDQAH